MRHLLSVVLSIILAPLIYVAAGLAAVKLQAAHHAATVDWTAAEIGLAAGVVAGALYAVLVMVRISPVGPLVAGLLYLGVTIWEFLDHANFAKVFDFNLFRQGTVLLSPVGAGTLLLAIPLIATVFSRRRWITEAQPGLPYDAAPAYTPAPLSAAPAYPEPPPAPTYGAPYPGEPAIVYAPQASSAPETVSMPTTSSAYQPEQPTYQPEQPTYQPGGYAAPQQVTPAYQPGEPTTTTSPESPTFDAWTPYSPERRSE